MLWGSFIARHGNPWSPYNIDDGFRVDISDDEGFFDVATDEVELIIVKVAEEMRLW